MAEESVNTYRDVLSQFQSFFESLTTAKRIVLFSVLAAVMIGMISLMPVALMFVTQIDTGLFLALILAVSLLMAAFTAVGVYMSTLTKQPTVAAISTFGILLILWIIDWAGSKVGDAGTSEALQYLSMLRHFEALSKGVFNSSDVIYYLLIITTFMVLSIRRLDADRLQH